MEKIGQLLKEKRLELGLTIDDVSEKTRLTPKHVKALEEGDISFFHDDLAYLRFFVKSYCDAVGIDFELVKDELRTSVNDYTMSFTKEAILTHEEIEKGIAKSEKLTKVSSISNKRKSKKKMRKLDFSLVSLIAVVGVVAIIIMFTFIVWLQSDKKADNNTAKPPIAGVEDGSGTNKTPTTKPKEEPKEEPKKAITTTKNDVTRYTIDNAKEGDELKFEVTFIGSNSGFSVTVDGKVLDDPKPDIYYAPNTVKATIKAKKNQKIQLTFGFLLNTDIKLNGKTVKVDDSIANAGGSQTLEFTVTGE